MYKKIGLIICLICVVQCRASFSSILKDKNYDGFYFSISSIDSLPTIVLEVGTHPFKDSNKRKLRFVIDTGSNLSLLNKNKFPELEKSQVLQMQLKSLNSYSDIKYSEIFLDVFQEESIIFENKKFIATQFPEFFQFDGIIGNNLLSEFDLVLNFPKSIYFLKKNRLISLSDHGFNGTPIRFIENYIVVDTYIDGLKKKNFLLDTGSGLSFIVQNEAEEKEFRSGRRSRYFDSLGNISTTETRIAKIGCILSKENCFNNPEFLTGKNTFHLNTLKNENITGLIGMNWLEKNEIVISYSEKKIYYKKKKKICTYD
ncbi:MAG: hypothetical protein L6Q54_10335 [Leptospiraceae bacterium]|nr:hypothetical protein [Leptospiraceae bacterium]MCK6381625.1 hypothetical protein [Leptospiraceae bacterium]NUM40816.1 hypothetical protein [Leptospiraceae bacterium]